jgi:hypothetical protein
MKYLLLILFSFNAYGVINLGVPPKDIITGSHSLDSSIDKYIQHVSSAGSSVDSSVNSSTTPLASGATFTGIGEKNSHSQVGVMLKTDNTGTLFFDFSNDGINWDSTFPVAGFLVASGISEFHTAVKLGRYFRVRFVNDVGAQTYFRLTVYYGDNFIPSVAPLNQSHGLDADATIVKTIPHWLQVNRGLVGGITFINKFGKNADASAGDNIEAGESPLTFPASAATLDVFSTSTEDDAVGGTGAFTVLISGIDENYDIATETVTLDGTVRVATVNSYWFVNTAKVVTASTVSGAVGTINFESNAVGTPSLAIIAIGINRTQSASYMVPRNCTAYLNLPQVTYTNVNNNAQSEMVLFKRVFGGVDEGQNDWLLQAGATSDYQPKTFGAGLRFEEKSIIHWKVISISTGTNAITVDYDIWLIAEL